MRSVPRLERLASSSDELRQSVTQWDSSCAVMDAPRMEEQTLGQMQVGRKTKEAPSKSCGCLLRAARDPICTQSSAPGELLQHTAWQFRVLVNYAEMRE